MKVLVTGGTGYIGSHTVVELQQQGYEVLIIDNLCNSSIKVLDNIEKITSVKPAFEKIDLCDYSLISNFFKKVMDINCIIHFAAYKAVGESVTAPLKYYSNNLNALINVLKCCVNFNVPNFVFSSSCTVYGQPDELPVTESSVVKSPASPYGNTKKISEEIITDTIKMAAINAISLRYFNPIGAHESALIGEKPSEIPNNLVPYITQTASGLRDVLNVYGTDYNTPDGTAIRDYIHVVDLAKAHVFALERLNAKLNKESFEVFNLGTGIGNTVFDVIRTFEDVSGLKLKCNLTKRRQGDVEKIWADTTKANNELGWRAEKNLADMLLSQWNWEKQLNK